MDDLRAGIEILPRAGEGDAGELHAGVVALEDAHGVQAADVGAEGAGYPLDRTALFDERALGVEVVHILRPVLDRGIAELRAFLHEQLDAARV